MKVLMRLLEGVERRIGFNVMRFGWVDKEYGVLGRLREVFSLERMDRGQQSCPLEVFNHELGFWQVRLGLGLGQGGQGGERV